MDSIGHSNYIFRDPYGDKPGEDKYGSIWKGVVMILLLFDSLTLKYHCILCILPLTIINCPLQIFQTSFENVDKDKFTWLVSDGCKKEKITECENWAFKLKSWPIQI